MNPLGSAKYNLTNRKFNRLTVLSYLGKSKWNCICDCGDFAIIDSKKLKNGHTKSCGCLKRESKGRPRLDNRKPDATVQGLLKAYKNNAAKRQLEFNLNLKEAVQLFRQNCYFCGSEPNQLRKGRAIDGSNDFIYNGIDRLENNKGYVIGNVVSCCKVCNFAKRLMNEQEFRNWIKKVYENMFKA